MIVRLVLAFVVLALGARAATADPEDGARKHAARANKLAAQNKCRAALSEFTRAYDVLKDPTLLFNRAECERKLGKVEDAVADYEHFLSDMPTAPNRASVEARIAELRGKTPKTESNETPPAAKPASPPDAGTKPERPTTPPQRAEKWTD